jgi:hypothetical protein
MLVCSDQKRGRLCSIAETVARHWSSEFEQSASYQPEASHDVGSTGSVLDSSTSLVSSLFEICSCRKRYQTYTPSYNSVVYLSIAVPDYRVIAVGESFVSGDPVTYFTWLDPFLGPAPVKMTYPHETYEETRGMYEGVRSGSYERLENLECINAYAQLFQTKRRNLVLVAADGKYPSTTSVLRQFGADTHIYWNLDFRGLLLYSTEKRRAKLFTGCAPR